MEIDLKPVVRKENESFESFKERRRLRNAEIKKRLKPKLFYSGRQTPFSTARTPYVRPKK